MLFLAGSILVSSCVVRKIEKVGDLVKLGAAHSRDAFRELKGDVPFDL